ncbi:hypothetical protein HDU98_008629 [Podochytrium sp. JEL0797]|nr:hypothetical protein HDU98_008629 [Podochytrium sp. JEL0797]
MATSLNLWPTPPLQTSITGSCGYPCSTTATTCSAPLTCQPPGVCMDAPFASQLGIALQCGLGDGFVDASGPCDSASCSGIAVSPPVDNHHGTRAVMTGLGSGVGGGGACLGQGNDVAERVVALSTGWFDNQSRCGNVVYLYWNGETTTATVVDECDSQNGACEGNVVQASESVCEALGCDASQNQYILWSDTLISDPLTIITRSPPPIPSDILNLTLWDIQLPDGSAGTLFPAVGLNNTRFFVNNSLVVFVTPANGVPTSGSTHPRTELRQMAVGGGNAAWSPQDGALHELTVTMRVDAFPTAGESVITAQMFCAGPTAGAMITFRVYASGNVVVFNDNNVPVHSLMLDTGYQVGQFFTVRLVASASGSVVVSYSNLASGKTAQTTMTVVASNTYYFKTGSYCQSLSTDTGFCQVSMQSLLLDGQNVVGSLPDEAAAGSLVAPGITSVGFSWVVVGCCVGVILLGVGVVWSLRSEKQEEKEIEQCSKFVVSVL